MNTKRAVVLVTWSDTVADSGWQDINHMVKSVEDGDHIAYSVGIIVKKDKQFLYLVGDFSDAIDNPYNRILIIPMGMVKKIKTIYRT